MFCCLQMVPSPPPHPSLIHLIHCGQIPLSKQTWFYHINLSRCQWGKVQAPQECVQNPWACLVTCPAQPPLTCALPPALARPWSSPHLSSTCPACPPLTYSSPDVSLAYTNLILLALFDYYNYSSNILKFYFKFGLFNWNLIKHYCILKIKIMKYKY